MKRLEIILIFLGGGFEDFNRGQYTIEIFGPVSLVFRGDSECATLDFGSGMFGILMKN